MTGLFALSWLTPVRDGPLRCGLRYALLTDQLANLLEDVLRLRPRTLEDLVTALVGVKHGVDRVCNGRTQAKEAHLLVLVRRKLAR